MQPLMMLSIGRWGLCEDRKNKRTWAFSLELPSRTLGAEPLSLLRHRRVSKLSSKVQNEHFSRNAFLLVLNPRKERRSFKKVHGPCCRRLGSPEELVAVESFLYRHPRLFIFIKCAAIPLLFWAFLRGVNNARAPWGDGVVVGGAGNRCAARGL